MLWWLLLLFRATNCMYYFKSVFKCVCSVLTGLSPGCPVIGVTVQWLNVAANKGNFVLNTSDGSRQGKPCLQD